MQFPVNRPGVKEAEENMEDPKFISLTFDGGVLSGKLQKICPIYSCWHKSHQACLEIDGAVVQGQQGDGDDNELIIQQLNN
jgi:hypothetical protein